MPKYHWTLNPYWKDQGQLYRSGTGRHRRRLTRFAKTFVVYALVSFTVTFIAVFGSIMFVFNPYGLDQIYNAAILIIAIATLVVAVIIYEARK